MRTGHCWRHSMMAAGILLALGGQQALAQGFDVSMIGVNPELAERVPASIKEAGVLVGASDNAYPPWEYLAGEDGMTPVGIDVDIGHAIAAKWGVTYESRTTEFASILPALGTTLDIGINAFSITNARKEVVDFVHYAYAGSEWIVRAGNPTGFDAANICGSSIALQPGTWYETQVTEANAACLAAGSEAIEMLFFGTQTEATTRVAVGGADATISGSGTVLFAVQQSGGAIEAIRPTGILGGTGKVGIPVPKSNPELSQLVADTINDLIADGTYRAIFDHWGIGPLAVEEATVNPEVDF